MKISWRSNNKGSKQRSSEGKWRVERKKKEIKSKKRLRYGKKTAVILRRVDTWIRVGKVRKACWREERKKKPYHSSWRRVESWISTGIKKKRKKRKESRNGGMKEEAIGHILKRRKGWIRVQKKRKEEVEIKLILKKERSYRENEGMTSCKEKRKEEKRKIKLKEQTGCKKKR